MYKLPLLRFRTKILLSFILISKNYFYFIAQKVRNYTKNQYIICNILYTTV